MSDTPMLRVIAYDIASDRRRRKVAETLEETCVRVQESVFEARLTHREAERLMKALEAIVTTEDGLRLYTIPDRALGRCRNRGGPAIADGARYWLI